MTIGQSVGSTITLDELERDPYPAYARLRDEEPVSFVPAVGLWLVTRHDDVKQVANDPDTFTAATNPSTLNRTMGVNMLGMEGPEQQWIRAITEVPFRPRDVEERTQGMIPRLAGELLDGLTVSRTREAVYSPIHRGSSSAVNTAGGGPAPGVEASSPSKSYNGCSRALEN